MSPSISSLKCGSNSCWIINILRYGRLDFERQALFNKSALKENPDRGRNVHSQLLEQFRSLVLQFLVQTYL